MKTHLFLACVLFSAASLHAKDKELRIRWEELSNSLAGQEVTIVQNDNKKSSGTLLQIDQDDLVLRRGTTSSTIPRVKVLRIETQRTFRRSRGRIIGTAVGAGVGIVVLAVALEYTHNENGSNSDTIVGACAGTAAGTTLLGYWAGRESDRDRTVIYIVPK